MKCRQEVYVHLSEQIGKSGDFSRLLVSERCLVSASLLLCFALDEISFCHLLRQLPYDSSLSSSSPLMIDLQSFSFSSIYLSISDPSPCRSLFQPINLSIVSSSFVSLSLIYRSLVYLSPVNLSLVYLSSVYLSLVYLSSVYLSLVYVSSVYLSICLESTCLS